MQNITDTMNEQFKQLFDMQTRSMEPLRIFASLNTDVAEQIARQNHAVAGDVLEYATKSANLPLSGDDSYSDKAKEAAEAASASFK